MMKSYAQNAETTTLAGELRPVRVLGAMQKTGVNTRKSQVENREYSSLISKWFCLR